MTRCASRRVGARSACARCRCTTRPCERATAGERVALGLPGVERSELHRGDALVARGRLPDLVPARRRARGARRDRQRRPRLRAPRHVADRRPGRARRRPVGAAAARGARRRGARRPRRAARGDDARGRDCARSRSAATARGGAPGAPRAGRSRLDRRGNRLGARFRSTRFRHADCSHRQSSRRGSRR